MEPYPLITQDRFSIGGRYTVRGFDGETTLIGERGWLLRNDLGLSLEAAKKRTSPLTMHTSEGRRPTYNKATTLPVPPWDCVEATAAYFGMSS